MSYVTEWFKESSTGWAAVIHACRQFDGSAKWVWMSEKEGNMSVPFVMEMAACPFGIECFKFTLLHVDYGDEMFYILKN